MTKDMTSGSTLRHIINFAVPLCMGMLFQQLYSMVDTMIVGKVLGVQPLAGVGATGSLNFMIIWFCLGICNGFSIPIAQAFGASKEVELRRYVANSTWLCVFFSIVITFFVCIFTRNMLVILKTPEDIFEYAYIYILIIFLGIPCTFLYNFLAGVARALGDSKTPLMFLILSSVMNIALDFILMIPIPLGVAGAAIATVISQGVSGGICLIYMKKKFPILKASRDEWRMRGNYMKRLCAIGVPMGLQYSITAIGSLVITAAVNVLGATAVAGVTAAQKINNLITCPLESLGQTMAPYTGQNIGAGKKERVSDGVKKASICGFVWSAICIPIVLLFGKPMTLLFLSEPNAEVVNYSFLFLLVSTLGYCLLTLVGTVRFSIQGMGYSGFAMTAGVLEMAARTIAGVVLAPLMGYMGICLSNVLAWIFADAFLLPAFRHCIKK